MDVSDTLRLAIAHPYTIEHELRQGGKAAACQGRDLHHHRHVSLKALLSGVSAALAGDRFLRSIQKAHGVCPAADVSG